MLDRLVVYHSDDVDRLSLEHSAVGRYSLPVDAGSDTIILGDHIFDPHFESRHGAARDLHDVRKAARSANLAFTEPLVIDIVRRDELINPGNVTRPKGLHHFQHHSLRWHPRMMSHSCRSVYGSANLTVSKIFRPESPVELDLTRMCALLAGLPDGIVTAVEDRLA
jgi:hypothetical protein